MDLLDGCFWCDQSLWRRFQAFKEKEEKEKQPGGQKKPYCPCACGKDPQHPAPLRGSGRCCTTWVTDRSGGDSNPAVRLFSVDSFSVNLRRATSSVLVGDHKQASSSVAMLYLSPKVQDPLLYLVTDMLTTLRRLFVYNPALAWQFITYIRSFTGDVRGPASALASYLKKLRWEVTANATLIGPGGLNINLRSSKFIKLSNPNRLGLVLSCRHLPPQRCPAGPF